MHASRDLSRIIAIHAGLRFEIRVACCDWFSGPSTLEPSAPHSASEGTRLVCVVGRRNSTRAYRSLPTASQVPAPVVKVDPRSYYRGLNDVLYFRISMTIVTLFSSLCMARCVGYFFYNDFILMSTRCGKGIHPQRHLIEVWKRFTVSCFAIVFLHAPLRGTFSH